jgi:peptide/nickel transport system permease protein
MLSYALQRIIYTIPVLLGVALVCFTLVHLSPGDPLASILPADASADLEARMRTLYGFDRSCFERFVLWLGRALQGDLGTSIASGRAVTTEVFRAVGNTLMLAAVATFIGFLRGCLFGFVAGYFSTPLDKAASAAAVFGVSVPRYWLGMTLVIIFSAQLGWLPSTGAGPGGSSRWQLDAAHLSYMILPALTMSVIPMGIIARTVRALVADILAQEFVTGLRARGLSKFGVFATS